MDLTKLSDPFPADDIEWRVSRSGTSSKGVYCHVLAYITARAIQSRLDSVCGPANWRNEPLVCHELRPGVVAMQVGISIRVNDEWITKWDVSEPTNIEPAKGGFSGAMKRAGAQWGIGRYLYHLTETFAEVSERGGRGWNWAKLPDKAGGGTYYWKPPTLPSWALPKEAEHEVTESELTALKREWKAKFATDITAPSELREGFERFVFSVVGEFPLSDHACWTKDALNRCLAQMTLSETEGIDGDVPFE